MGRRKADASAKVPNAVAAAQDQSPAIGANPATPVYLDWASYQAYSQLAPHGIFPSHLASSARPQSYMWGPQPMTMMPTYGTPSSQYVMYPQGVYANQSIPPGSHPFSAYAMPSPNVNAEASGATHGGIEVDVKPPEGMEKTPLKSSKGNPSSLNMITAKNNNDPGKTSGASANGGTSHSGESGSEDSSEGSDANSQNDSQPKTTGGEDTYVEAQQTGDNHSSQNGALSTPSQAALNRVIPLMSMATVGMPGGVVGPTSNLNRGVTTPSPVPPIWSKVPSTAVGGAMVPGTQSELWMQVIRSMTHSKKPPMLDSSIPDVAEIMNPQLETRTGSVKNMMWTTEMDLCATDELIVQMNKGNKIERNFTNAGYEATCSKLLEKCGVRVSIGNLKNRLKTLRNYLTAFQEIQSYGNGFSFNKDTKMMDAEPQVWEDYIKAHPKGKQFQQKPMPSFENMLLIFGNDKPIAKDPETIKEKCIRLKREEKESNSIASNQEGDKKVEQEDDGDSIAPSTHKRQHPKDASGSSKLIHKRKHVATASRSEDFQILRSGMDSVATAISKCGPRVYTEEELFEVVSKVEGLDEDAQLLAYDYLCGDAIRGRTFIGLPISRRKRWLELKLGWSSDNCEIGARSSKETSKNGGYGSASSWEFG